MSNFQIMASVTATYKPQNGQKFRCSPNIQNWNTPAGGKLKFKVEVSGNYPQPVFSVVHDKKGKDVTWYQNISDNLEIPVDSGEGEPGVHNVYIGTTSPLQPGMNGAEEYEVTIYASPS